MSRFPGYLCDDPNPVKGRDEYNSMSQMILYYTEHCHLCDEAEALLHSAGYGECYTKVEIENKPELLKLYEIHIPVLKHADSDKELFWPFGLQELTTFWGEGK